MNIRLNNLKHTWSLMESTENKKIEGYCYMLYASKESQDELVQIQKDFELDGDITIPEELHCTIRYMKTDMDIEPFIEYMESLELGEIYASIVSVDIYGDGKCLVLELEGKTIHEWFGRVNGFLEDSGYPKSEYPNYNPHITLTCGTEMDNVRDLIKPEHKLPIKFNRHVVTVDKDDDYVKIFDKTI